MAFVAIQAGLNRPDRQPQPHVQRAHPLHVAPCEIIVHGHDVDPLALDRVEIARECGDQRFAFAGDHFGDVAGMENHAANHLNVVMTHAQKTASRLAAGGKRLDQQVVQRFAVSEPAAEFDGLLLQLVVAHRLELGFQGVDRLDLCL